MAALMPELVVRVFEAGSGDDIEANPERVIKNLDVEDGTVWIYLDGETLRVTQTMANQMAQRFYDAGGYALGRAGVGKPQVVHGLTAALALIGIEVIPDAS